MHTNCQKCGCKFSRHEMNKFIETAQYAEPICICDECHEMQQYECEPDYEQYSDADSGL